MIKTYKEQRDWLTNDINMRDAMLRLLGNFILLRRDIFEKCVIPASLRLVCQAPVGRVKGGVT